MSSSNKRTAEIAFGSELDIFEPQPSMASLMRARRKRLSAMKTKPLPLEAYFDYHAFSQRVIQRHEHCSEFFDSCDCYDCTP
jgi:hypothetical protein